MTVLLNEFGNYLYKSFDIKNISPLVPLKDELSLVQSYIYIHKQRFQDRIKVEWEIEEEEITNIQVPPLSLQTLVENALKHDILKHSAGGTINITGTISQNSFQLTIEGNGVAMSEGKIKEIMSQQGKQQGIGLVNTNKRLEKY